MKISDLTDAQQSQLAAELADDMIGGNSIGHTSLVAATFASFGIEDSINWNDAMQFCQEKGISLDECPCCGWVSEGNFYHHPDYEGVCDQCEEEE